MLNSRISLFIILFFVSIQTIGQNNRITDFKNWLDEKLSNGQTIEDSLIKLKYFNDTLGFTSFPNTSLPDLLIPRKGISYWELNWSLGTDRFTNLYRSTTGMNKLKNDTNVLTKTINGFGTVCPPGWCSWFISAKYKNGKIVTVNDTSGFSEFIGKIDNQFDAYLWLTCFPFSDSKGIPVKISSSSKYKRIKNNYLIAINLRISDCPEVIADLLYFVRNDKKVTYIKTLRTTRNSGCI